MRYTNFKKVSYYQTLFKGQYNFYIACNEKSYYAIIVHGSEMITEKANSIAVAKQILLNQLYRLIHADAHTDKSKTELLEQVKAYKTAEITNFIY